MDLPNSALSLTNPGVMPLIEPFVIKVKKEIIRKMTCFFHCGQVTGSLGSSVGVGTKIRSVPLTCERVIVSVVGSQQMRRISLRDD